MVNITKLHALEVLDSRGNPTVEVSMTIDNQRTGRAIVPSGASTGSHEALELRDGDAKRYGGKGTLKAVANVNEAISSAVIGKDFDSLATFEQTLIDLDGTPNKSKLGANAILACGMAYAQADAQKNGKRLYEYLGNQDSCVMPVPYMNIINGGAHADNGLDFQEFMIIPQGASSFHEGLRMGAEVFHTLKKLLKAQGLATSVGDEGGYAPNIRSNREALDLVIKAIQDAGYTTDQIKIGLDVASTEFFKDGKYNISGEGKILTPKEMAQYYLDLVKDYPIVSIEDGFSEDDFEGWSFFESMNPGIRTVGDDLYVTNVQRLEQGIAQKLSNSILIKLNQIGSVTETLKTIKLAHDNNMHSIISHRSGESEDTFIADLAVAVNSGYIKTGSLSRTDRIAKYNQLLRIEQQLGSKAKYGK
ncbi:MAG TPA: phosphopyruvate hydratase [Candidatus Absconditabacterales bacterium]|nr:phosphopyruvate hydratase [Candidatus Absconditabacterales bacterium]